MIEEQYGETMHKTYHIKEDKDVWHNSQPESKKPELEPEKQWEFHQSSPYLV